MTEQQFIYEVKDCCKRISNDRLNGLIGDNYLDNMNLRYHDDKVTWVEYFGTRLENYDRRAVEMLGRIVNAVCDKHRIVFLKCFRLG